MTAVAPVQDQREFELSDRDYAYISKFVYERAGIVLSDHKRDMVYARLARRLRVLGLTSFSEYCGLIKGPKGDGEIGFMINAVTTNLTKFFRESHHFDHMRETLLPQVRQDAQAKRKKRLRIWSAGCSSGEEPYTIAMVLCDVMSDLDLWDARVLATDLDTNMLATASAGIYDAKRVEGMPVEYRKRFCIRSGTIDDRRYKMNESVRRLIAFKHLNLLTDWPMRGPFDAIFCRNVMIYFDNPTKSRLIERFAALLSPGGWLYVGHAESLRAEATMFQSIGQSIYRKAA